MSLSICVPVLNYAVYTLHMPAILCVKVYFIIMNVFFQIQNNLADQEILEYIEGEGEKVFISHSTDESISILSEHVFEKAVISLKNLQDVAILKYLNEYYPDIQVVVLANKTFDDIISVFQKLNCSVIHEPLRLSELKGQLHNKHQGIQK